GRSVSTTHEVKAVGFEFPSGPIWLPVVVTTEGRSSRASEVLDTWEVTVPLPERPSFGRNRFRPTEEARLSAARRRLRAAGHAKDKVDGQSSDCGPADPAAGHGCGPREDDDEEGDPWAHALARVRGVLARARRWQAWLDEDPGRTAVDVARKEGLSRARVSQVRRLLDLEPSILADLDRPDRAGPVPSELVLRRIAALPTAEAQRSRYAAVCTPAAPTSGGVRRRDDPGSQPPPRREDFQHVLARARRYQGWLDDGTHPTLASIARAEGISATRVGQLLALLHLDLEIIEVLERPRGELPDGLTRRAVREIARLRGHEVQRAAFEARWPGVLGRAVAAK
ncbi:MAG: hypothetical protein JW751_00080, partial [Polyangiaceae bacterium]|nr:hypothetical protein [Polyangiaceae bacterium]